MSYPQMQQVIVRLLRDRDARRRFFDEGDLDADLGVRPEEALPLRGLDERRFNLISEGFVGKRFERLDGEFRLTLAALDQHAPNWRVRYLAATQIPARMDDEFKNFNSWLDGYEGPLGSLAQDLRDVEAAIHRQPPVKSLVVQWDPAREFGHAPSFTPLLLRGRVDRWIHGSRSAEGVEYPADAGRHLVWRIGTLLQCPRLEGPLSALWEACKGPIRAKDVSAWGNGASRIVHEWLTAGALVDAGPSSPTGGFA